MDEIVETFEISNPGDAADVSCISNVVSTCNVGFYVVALYLLCAAGVINRLRCYLQDSQCKQVPRAET